MKSKTCLGSRLFARDYKEDNIETYIATDVLIINYRHADGVNMLTLKKQTRLKLKETYGYLKKKSSIRRKNIPNRH